MEDKNKMDAHAELQNSVAKTRTAVFVCQPEEGKWGSRSLEKFPVEALAPDGPRTEPSSD